MKNTKNISKITGPVSSLPAIYFKPGLDCFKLNDNFFLASAPYKGVCIQHSELFKAIFTKLIKIMGNVLLIILNNTPKNSPKNLLKTHCQLLKNLFKNFFYPPLRGAKGDVFNSFIH